MGTEDGKDKIGKILKEIEHPEIARTLFDLGMIKDVSIGENKLTFVLKVPMLSVPIKDYLIDNIKKAVKAVSEGVDVEVSLQEMDQEERAKFMAMAQEAWRA